MKYKIPIFGFEQPVNMCVRCCPKGFVPSLQGNSKPLSNGLGVGDGDNTNDNPLGNIDDDPLGIFSSENTNQNSENSNDKNNSFTQECGDEELLTIDSPQKNSQQVQKNNQNNNKNNNNSSLSKSSNTPVYGQSIFNVFRIAGGSVKVVSSQISYDKRWLVACLSDKTLRIFDIKDLL